MLPEAFYLRDVDIFHPTQATSGPWSPDAQHAGPPSALLLRAIEAASGIEDAQTARISVDILRPIPVAPLLVETRVLRGGKRVEQIEATLAVVADSSVVMRARAWRLLRRPFDLPEGLGVPEPPPPGPAGLPEHPRPSFWKGDVTYWDALEWRIVRGEFEVSEPACHWTRLRIPLVAGEPTTPLQHLLVMGDAASGISSVFPMREVNFANVDFSVALERPPAGEWLAMDAVTRPGPVGAGVCSAVMFDADGRVGESSQTLVIAAHSS
jgi:hypothetical protein